MCRRPMHCGRCATCRKTWTPLADELLPEARPLLELHLLQQKNEGYERVRRQHRGSLARHDRQVGGKLKAITGVLVHRRGACNWSETYSDDFCDATARCAIQKRVRGVGRIDVSRRVQATTQTLCKLSRSQLVLCCCVCTAPLPRVDHVPCADASRCQEGVSNPPS